MLFPPTRSPDLISKASANQSIHLKVSIMAAQAISNASLLSSSRNVSVRSAPRRGSRAAVRPFAARARQVSDVKQSPCMQSSVDHH